MQDTDVNYVLSQRSSYLERSVMRELLKHAVDPKLIAFATGLPANEDLPTQQLQDCMNAVIQRDGGGAFQYNPPYQPLKEELAKYISGRGIAATADDIFITNGNQQALAILSQLFVNEGDSVVTEEIVYTGIQQGTRFTGANVHTVATDLESGVDVVELEKIFQQQDVKFAVMIPDFHNPLGVAMSDAKRRRVAQLAAQYRVPIMEDDAYSPLRFTGEMLPPLRSYDDSGYVFYCGSFSKMLAPALRMGFIIIPESLRTKITVIREASDLETSTFMQRTVAEFLQRDYLEPHLEQLRLSLQRRTDALMTALEKYLGDIATWTVPEGGLFSWCVLPEQINTWEMFDAALQAGVVYLPGGAFSVKREHTNTMRLNFSRVAPETFDEGIKRLNQVIRENL